MDLSAGVYFFKRSHGQEYIEMEDSSPQSDGVWKLEEIELLHSLPRQFFVESKPKLNRDSSKRTIQIFSFTELILFASFKGWHCVPEPNLLKVLLRSRTGQICFDPSWIQIFRLLVDRLDREPAKKNKLALLKWIFHSLSNSWRLPGEWVWKDVESGSFAGFGSAIEQRPFDFAVAPTGQTVEFFRESVLY